ncbi:hypothetical protein J5837_15230 [Pseudoxanthomonas helianthi]|uniref:Uncharacterized protein n=1 Tax=Pseudoxanthomonas helianthi TaxID=1453541 RepID=A0A940X6D0_9GAMM|nr:hypothetical protein [Pseudoxanthomonas helianthi]MBP3985762.1 hypothetical protein [Pseudoxanthomonas helianthi]
MNKSGRPRKVRSKPISGVGGRPFSAPEKKQLLEIGEQYGLDRDEVADCDAYLEALWLAHGSYCATEHALVKQASVGDEKRDIETLLQRAKLVQRLVNQHAELKDDQGCFKAAQALSQSLHAFPGLTDAQISAMEERSAFLEARQLLRLHIVRVRLWEPHREEFAHALEVVIDVCERVQPPKAFTKRFRAARDMFERELGALYLKHLHPRREADWRETNRDPNNPPPPRSTDQFAKAVMAILGVKFEVKGVSG